MPDLILRPSTRNPAKPWALQLRYHESYGETECATIAYVSEDMGREIVKAGKAYWLFGEPALPD